VSSGDIAAISPSAIRDARLGKEVDVKLTPYDLRSLQITRDELAQALRADESAETPPRNKQKTASRRARLEQLDRILKEHFEKRG
jgi:hypothetical protein